MAPAGGIRAPPGTCSSLFSVALVSANRKLFMFVSHTLQAHCRIQVALSALTCGFSLFESWEISCGLLGDVPRFLCPPCEPKSAKSIVVYR